MPPWIHAEGCPEQEGEASSQKTRRSQDTSAGRRLLPGISNQAQEAWLPAYKCGARRVGRQLASGQGEEEEDECRGAPREEAESTQQHPKRDEPDPDGSPADHAHLPQAPDILPHPRHPLGWSTARVRQEWRIWQPGGRGARGGHGGGQRGQLGPRSCPRAAFWEPSSSRSTPSPSPRDTPRGGHR